MEWSRRGVIAMNHDLQAERVLAALDGQPPACIQVLSAWDQGAPSEAIAMAGRPGSDPRHRRAAMQTNLARDAGFLAAGIRDLPKSEEIVSSLKGGVDYYSAHLALWSLPEIARIRWCYDVLARMPTEPPRELVPHLRSAMKWRLVTFAEKLGGPADIRGLDLKVVDAGLQVALRTLTKPTLELPYTWLKRSLNPDWCLRDDGIALDAGRGSDVTLTWT